MNLNIFKDRYKEFPVSQEALESCGACGGDIMPLKSSAECLSPHWVCRATLVQIPEWSGQNQLTVHSMVHPTRKITKKHHPAAKLSTGHSKIQLARKIISTETK